MRIDLRIVIILVLILGARRVVYCRRRVLLAILLSAEGLIEEKTSNKKAVEESSQGNWRFSKKKNSKKKFKMRPSNWGTRENENETNDGCAYANSIFALVGANFKRKEFELPAFSWTAWRCFMYRTIILLGLVEE